MAWEALNNIAAGRDRNVVIVVNDNGRSYAPTIGGLADRLASLRLQPGYERVLEAGKDTLRRTPVVGRPIYAGLHALKAGVKDALSPQELFADLGLKYFGPVDGHDVAAMESALRRARHFGGPVIVHAVTRKGCGYAPAENDVAEQMHSPAAFDPETGPAHGAHAGGLDDGVRRGDGGARARAPGRRRDHRGDARPDGARPVRRGLPGPLLRRRHRRAARADLGGGPGRGRAAPGRRDLLDVPQPGVRPAAHGRRAAPPGRHAGAGPGRGHRQRRAVAQRDVGPVDPRRRARASGSPRRGTPRRCARSWPRPSRSTTGRRPCASRREP